MPAKTILFAIACLAPLRLAADDGVNDRPSRYAGRPPAHDAARETPPRRLPGGSANALQRESAASAEIESASFVADDSQDAGLRAKRAPLNLPPRSDKDAKGGQGARRIRPAGAASSLLTGAASLAIVLGLFFAAAWALRRGMPAAPAALPGEVVEVLGRTQLANRQHAHLLRCGNKLLLVYVSQGVAETLTEITDPLEVDRLTGICRQSHPQSATKTFRQTLQQFAREKTAPGFLELPGSLARRETKPPRSRGEAAPLEDADV